MMIECDYMKNNKGQALVEFIIVLPILLLLVISVVDFGNIILKKYSLENDLDTVTDMYKENNYDGINKYINDKNIEIGYENDNEFLTINLSKDIRVTSPILNTIFGKSYKINTSKVVYKNE